MHRNTPSKAKENLGTSGRSVISLNSSTSELWDSSKHSASSLTVEIPVPSGTTDLSNKILPKTSELVFSTISSDLKISNSEPLAADHNVHEHFRPKIGSGVSTDSALSHCSKQNQGLEKRIAVGVPPLKSGSTATARSNMTLTAKDPTNYKQNHGFGKGKVADLPTKSVSTSAAHNSMIFSAKDPPSKSGCPRPVNLQSKPTGLRMPTPKHGFFDTEKVIRAPHPAVQKRSSSNHFLPPKSIPKGPSGIPQGSKLKPPGVPLPHNRGTVPSVISMATHLRPESASASSIASIPASLPRLQLKTDVEGSGLSLLPHQKFGLSPRGQQGSDDQRSDQIQLSLGACNAAAQSSFSEVDHHNQKSTCSDVSEEEQSQLSFVHEKHNLQDISHTCSEQKNANANGTVTSSLIDTSKASDMNDISCLQPHYQCGTAVVAEATRVSASEPLQSEHLLYSIHEDMTKVSEEFMFKSAAKEISSNRSPLDVNSNLLNSLDHGTFQKHANGQNSVDNTKSLALSAVSSPILDDIADKENMLGHEEQAMDSHEEQAMDSHRGINSSRKLVDDMNIQVQNIKNLEAPPFSEEWLRAMEAAGEELLQMKSGRVQHSPPDKIVPEPGPWSPVRRHSQQIGPFDCTKYTNAPGTSGDCQDQ
ncbi:uncharacterized protein LOC131038948 [Cryptomeria japonica]|uniref:uncharacterized protein LOC131038948 n=1 Tax=Cryptomeria japonica TaxID=3369 RepID=UPI0027DA4867|nr:uncharacterized protein LOC131038948 [Cryptomeria japonica]